jgi:hypothetical protein
MRRAGVRQAHYCLSMRCLSAGVGAGPAIQGAPGRDGRPFSQFPRRCRERQQGKGDQERDPVPLEIGWRQEAGTTCLNGTGEVMLRPSSSSTIPVSRLVVRKRIGQRGRTRHSTQAWRDETHILCSQRQPSHLKRKRASPIHLSQGSIVSKILSHRLLEC